MSVCVGVCTHVSTDAQSLEEDMGSPGAGVIGSYEPPAISAVK